MKLSELVNYAENNADKIIVNAIIKDDSETLNKFVINIIGDLLNGVNLDNEYRKQAINNLNNYDSRELGNLGTYICLTPYVQSVLSNQKNWETKATSFIENLISYIIGLISKDEFLNNLLEMRRILKISDNFYNGLVNHFASYKEYITKSAIEKIK